MTQRKKLIKIDKKHNLKYKNQVHTCDTTARVHGVSWCGKNQHCTRTHSKPYLRSITFKIDIDVDIALFTLCNMVAVDHSVKQMAALQMSISSHCIQEQISAQSDWDW